MELWNRPKFYNGVRRIVVDEAHCIESWGGTFCPPYEQLSWLSCILTTRAPQVQWYLTSATLSPDMVSSTLRTLELPRFTFDPTIGGRSLWMQRSSDRPNLYYVAHRMTASAKSYRDLGFLIPDGLRPTDPQPSSFLVYCNKRSETEGGAKYLLSRLPPDMQHSIIWVHSGMSDKHRQKAMEGFMNGTILGIFCTEALGLVCAPYSGWIQIS